MTDSRTLDLVLSEKQTQAWDTLANPEIREVLYGGAKGGGKSHLGCFWVAKQALKIIDVCNLSPSSDPPSIGFMGRRRGSDFRRTTLKTWKEKIPRGLYRIRKQASEIIIAETVAIDFGGLDDQQGVNKFNSAEYCFVFMDQAEEIEEKEIDELRLSLRMKITAVDDEGRSYMYTPDFKVLWTANPRQCWLKDDFILAPGTQRRYIQALPGDNPHLDSGYVPRLKEALKHRPGLLEGYLYGSWDAFEGDDQVILAKWIQNARSRTLHKHRRTLITCDPARFGDDETVIYRLLNTGEIVDELIYGKKETTYTANRLFVMQKEFNCPVVIDIVGMPGIYDMLINMGANAIPFNGANRKLLMRADRHHNLRAEAFSLAGKMFCDGDIQLHHEDAQLDGELLTPTYKFRNGRILIEKKEEIKKRLGRSPDRADAYVMGLWALSRGYATELPPKDGKPRKHDAWDERPMRGRIPAMAA